MKEIDIYKKFVEKFIDGNTIFWKSPSFKNMRWDIFGIFDLILIQNNVDKIYQDFIQLTTLSHLSHRRKKIQDYFFQIGFSIPNSYIYAYDEKKDNWKIEKQE